MSSPARAEGYDTPGQQREDSTTFMRIHAAGAQLEAVSTLTQASLTYHRQPSS